MKEFIGIMIIGLLLVSACTQTTPNGKTPWANSEQGRTNLAGNTQELQKFNSKEELRQYLKANQGTNYYGGARSGAMVMDMAPMAQEAAPTMAMGTTKAESGATDYSTTNVQVQGVDEADFVKNDNKYLYTLSDNNLVIIDAYPAKNATIVSKTDIDGTPRDMFVNGDELVVFVSRNDYLYTIPEFDIVPSQRYTHQLHVIVYDISNRAKPTIKHEYTINGNYLQSRMINNKVYFLTQEYVQFYDYYPETPAIKEGNTTVIEPEIYYFDNPESNYRFTTVTAMDLSSGDLEAKSYLMGYASTIYMSKENLYIAYQQQYPYHYYENQKEEKFWGAVVPHLPSETRKEIEAIKGENPAEEWPLIRDSIQRMYKEMNESETQDLLDEINDAVREWEWNREEERQKTVIQKIAVDNLDYVGRGKVKGRLLNQFSMDEYDGNLRVATTTNVYSSKGSTAWNNVYILDGKMRQIGALEKLAEDERIYSTRFMGDRLYMVTFQRVDPLFVIGLTNPRQPVVLGTLKIPGFSDYLHPYDATHIIGVGKETKENEWGGISTTGIKMALFDVSDVTNPKQVDMVKIGGPGSSTEVSRDHKAFLFDKEKNLLVLPVREMKEDWQWDHQYTRQYNRVWQGAYVYTVTENGFEERGKVSHFEGDEQSRWYWGSPYAVRRSLFMDDVLYTISQRKVEMDDLETVKEIKSIDLPYSEPNYRPPIRPMGVAMR